MLSFLINNKLFYLNNFIEFYIFIIISIIIIISSYFVISCSNTIHSVLFLIIVFFNCGILLLLLDVEFLALIFIIIYVGAIAVLFLFVIMMLNVKIIEMTEMIMKYLPLSGLMGLIFVFETYMIIFNEIINININIFEELNYFNFNYFDWIDIEIYNIINIKLLGQIIYTYFFFSFILAGLILLLAMIGSIVLTLIYKTNVKRQVFWNQINKKFILKLI